MEAHYARAGLRRLAERAKAARRPWSTLARRAALVPLAAALLLVGASDARASVAPRETAPGPALTAPAGALDAGLSCPQGVRGDRDPVLLVPGASGDPTSAFLGLEAVLRAKDYPVCGVTLPGAGYADIQIQAESVVASIRRIAARSGRPVSVIAVSSGSPVARWALKWWPDLRSLVGDVIGIAPANHGVGSVLQTLCGHGPCAPATRQLLPASRFFAALNGGDETPGRLAYSVITSANDLNVPTQYSPLKGESDDSNITIQTICPGRNVEHGQMEAVTVALVLDALRHEGPARASRIPKATCGKTYADGIDPQEVEHEAEAGFAYAVANYGRAGLTESEPALKKYATRSAPRPTATLRMHPHRLRPGKRTTVSFLAAGTSGSQRWPLARARIGIAGRELATNAHGKASLRLPVRRPGVLRVRLDAPGLAPVTERLAVRRRRAATSQARPARSAPAHAKPASCTGKHWVGVWSASPSDAGAQNSRSLAGQTARTVLTPLGAGKKLRVHLTNVMSAEPVTIDAASVARSTRGASINAKSLRRLRFDGDRSVTIPAGGQVVSDPVRLKVGAFKRLAVSTYVDPSSDGLVTEHWLGRQTSYLAAGNRVRASGSGSYGQTSLSRFIVAGVDVRAPRTLGAVAALGDSITDGYQGDVVPGMQSQVGVDEDVRYPDFLARRLTTRRGAQRLTVLNAGISGNRVLRDGLIPRMGPSGLSRLDRDVIGLAGVRTVIVMEGLNDIGQPPVANADEVIGGLRQLVQRLKAARLRVLLGTLTPAGGFGTYGDRNAIRIAVNDWIRSQKISDGVVDFDAALRDPADPSRLLPRFDSGDHAHPSTAGYRAMAAAVPLKRLGAGKCG